MPRRTPSPLPPATTTPPRSDAAPSWFHSPPQQSDHHDRDAEGGFAHDRTTMHNDESDDDESLERAPLLSPQPARHTTAAALSPSTGGASSLLRRSTRGGVRSKRHCTDVLFLALFVAYWVGMLTLGIFAVTRDSNVSWAKYIKDGIDYEGEPCGVNRFVYFPDYQLNPDFGVCVDTCPATAGETIHVNLPVLTDPAAAAGIVGHAGAANAVNQTRHAVTFLSYATHAWTYVCAPAGVKNEAVMIAQLQDTIGRFVGALSECWQVLLVSCGVALALAALYLIFLRYCGCLTVFVSIVGVQSILVYASYRLLIAASNPVYYTDDPAMRSSLQVAAVALASSAVLFFVFAFAVLPRLVIGAAFITHASRALAQLKPLWAMPLLSSGLLTLLFAYAIAVTVCLFGAGHTTSRIATIAAYEPAAVDVVTESFVVSTHLRWLFLVHLWGVYWSATFILQIGEVVTATAVSVWYFAADDHATNTKVLVSTTNRVDPVTYALKSTLRFHLGTIALSAAVVSPVATLQSFFVYLDEKNDYDRNPVTDGLAKCCCCCSWLFKACLQFICKEAVYITAIQGTSFYPSAKLATTLIGSNLLRVGALNRIGHASVLLGKLIVCSVTCLIAWFLLQDISSPLLPLLAILLFSYSVAHAFLTIYETTVNMLLMCFTLDENMHGGRGNAAFAPAPLIQSVNNHLRPKWQTML